MPHPPVIIIAGSKSDSKIVEKATKELDNQVIDYTVYYTSAHREPDTLDEILNDTSNSEEVKVYITVAGLSAALPGVVASKVNQPVIGVPVSAKLGGLDALLSIVQMPPGVPVASVGIDNGRNAAVLAARIIGLLE